MCNKTHTSLWAFYAHCVSMAEEGNGSILALYPSFVGNGLERLAMIGLLVVGVTPVQLSN
jgi:hypothetical protein